MKQPNTFLHKLMHWEYWPFEVINFPIFFLWIYYSFKSKSFFFFNATNPSIKNGGFLMESKKEIYDLIPEKYIPKTIYCTKNDSIETIKQKIKTNNISFPCIAKPDIGMKGLAVAILNNSNDLKNYIAKVPINFLIQEFIDYTQEVGIFYCRLPNSPNGFVSGIVYKEFLEVVGNGKSSIRELILSNARATMQLQSLEEIYTSELENILPLGKKFNLCPLGNHYRGAKFIDAKHWITPKMNATIDALCKQVPNFYFGRLDIKFDNITDLENGEKFSIIELNGAGSEPTHIYDPKHSIFFAWKEIARHLNLQYKISKINHQKGHKFLRFKEGISMFQQNALLVKQLKAF